MAQGAQQRRSEVGSSPSTPTRALGLAPVVLFWGWHPSQSRWSGRAGPVDGRSVVDAAAAHTDSAPRSFVRGSGLVPRSACIPRSPSTRSTGLGPCVGALHGAARVAANNQCPQQQQQRHLRARRTGIERDRRRKLENGPREFSGDSCGFGWDRGSTRRRPHPWIRLGKRRVGGRGGARQTERSPKSSSAASFGGCVQCDEKQAPGDAVAAALASSLARFFGVVGFVGVDRLAPGGSAWMTERRRREREGARRAASGKQQRWWRLDLESARKHGLGGLEPGSGRDCLASVGGVAHSTPPGH